MEVIATSFIALLFIFPLHKKHRDLLPHNKSLSEK